MAHISGFSRTRVNRLTDRLWALISSTIMVIWRFHFSDEQVKHHFSHLCKSTTFHKHMRMERSGLSTLACEDGGPLVWSPSIPLDFSVTYFLFSLI